MGPGRGSSEAQGATDSQAHPLMERSSGGRWLGAGVEVSAHRVENGSCSALWPACGSSPRGTRGKPLQKQTNVALALGWVSGVWF